MTLIVDLGIILSSTEPENPRETRASTIIKRERGKGEGPGEEGGSLGILGEGPGVVDLQRCWGCDEQSYQGRI